MPPPETQFKPRCSPPACTPPPLRQTRFVRPGGQRPSAALGRPGTGELSGPIEAASGFLLRSRVVSGWPTLEVTGYDEAGNPLTVLRMDHLAPGVLLFLVEGLVHHVDIHEPAEGLHFGLDVGDDGSARRGHAG